MTPRGTRTAAAAVLLLLTAGCRSGQPGVPQDVMSSNVDVDTVQLRAQKADAGIQDCPTFADRLPADGGLPELTLPCLGGGPAVDLSTLRGPLVVNLFAQWCEPCRTELPLYERLHQDARGKLRVLGIDYLDTQPGGALELARVSGVTFPLVADPDGLLRPEFRIRGLPGVVFVDAEGRVTHVEFTVVRSYAQLTTMVAEHLDVDV